MRNLSRARREMFLREVANEHLVIHGLRLCRLALRRINEQRRLRLGSREDEDSVSANAPMTVSQQADACHPRQEATLRACIQHQIFFSVHRIAHHHHHIGRLPFISWLHYIRHFTP